MKDTPRGSRIAHVHNGSALFTGDAGQGESEIRKWILENDWLEAIIGLPLNMFYNTGIATYIWVLTNRKPEHRQGKVQLIDAREMYTKLRKNLGSKNCEFADDHLAEIMRIFLDFEENENSKIFNNEDFGYHKITVERPLRLTTYVTPERMTSFKAENPAEWHLLADGLAEVVGTEPHDDFNVVQQQYKQWLKFQKVKATAKQMKVIWATFTERDEGAAPVVQGTRKTALSDQHLKRVPRTAQDAYKPDPKLRDTENVPLTETIEAYFVREVLPHVPDAWIDESKTVRGYEISFTKYFYQYQPLRSLDEIVADIRALEAETEGLLEKIVQ